MLAHRAVRTLPQRVRSVLRKYGSDAHLYLFGPSGNLVRGFQPGNYFDSAGTTHASVDGSVGLVLDAAGSVGAELAPPIDVGSWSGGSGGVISVVSGSVNIANSATNSFANGTTTATTIGKTYRIKITNSGVSLNTINVYVRDASNVAADVVAGVSVSPGTSYEQVFVANTTTTQIRIFSIGASGTNARFTAVSVREVTGIHATQGTPGFKPTLRKGIVNLAKYSQDFAHAYWNKGGGSSVEVVQNASPDGIDYASKLICPTNTNVWGGLNVESGRTYTVAIVFEQDTAPVFGIEFNSGHSGSWRYTFADGNQSGAALTSPTVTSLGNGHFIVTGQITPSGTAPNIFLYGNGGYTDPAGSSIVYRVGLFAGTLTAAQILAAGGIPLTTTAPASSQAGVSYLEFDGVDDRLDLGGPLFQMADDHCVVLVFSPQNLQATFSYPSGVAGNSCRYAAIGTTAGGEYIIEWWDGSNYVNYQTPCVLGEPVVITAWKAGGNLIARKNGVQFGSGAAFTTAVQATLGYIGQGALGSGKGKVYANPVVKGTLTLADVQLLEKQAAAAAGIQL